jgi:hypothetical protein
VSQYPISPIPERSKRTLGDQVRSIANQIQQETDRQIKATSRILGAAAQISENHDRLIREVVDMVEEDLDNQTHQAQTKPFTVDALKQQFRTLGDAKSHFGLKASSWVMLTNKLNHPSGNNPIASDSSQTITKRLDIIDDELKALRFEVSQVVILLKQLTADKESLSKRLNSK